MPMAKPKTIRDSFHESGDLIFFNTFNEMCRIELFQYPNVPELNCFAYLLQYDGQLVAHPIFSFGFCFSSPVPRLLAADRGNPEGAANWGRFFFGYFILAKQKKVISCRSTPGEFDLVLI